MGFAFSVLRSALRRMCVSALLVLVTLVHSYYVTKNPDAFKIPVKYAERKTLNAERKTQNAEQKLNI